MSFFRRSADEWARGSIGPFHLLYHWKPQPSLKFSHLNPSSEEGQETVVKFLELTQFRLLHVFLKELEVPLSRTESPIEELMLLALIIVASNEGEVILRVDGEDYGYRFIGRDS
jgi:hypothetical protein